MLNQLLILLAAIVIPTLVALFFSGLYYDKRAWLASLAGIGAVIVNVLGLGLGSSLMVFESLEWNWFGKVSAIVLTTVMYFFLPRALRAEAGLFTLPRTTNWKPVVNVSIGLLFFFWGISYYFRDGAPASFEALLFQGLMPGLDEESLFRGVLLAIFIAAFGKPLRVVGIQIGWGALPIVIFFGLVHGLSQELSVDTIVSIFAATIMGAGFLWLKERTGSIWVAVVVHNLANLGATLLNSLSVMH